MKRVLRSVFVLLTSGVLMVAATSPAHAKSSVPFKGSDSGSAQVISNSGGILHTADTASGHATHLGRYTLVASETIDLATGAITVGSFTLTAANGDTVTGTYSGQALPGLTGYNVSGPITGGTGRFAGATGFLFWHGTFDPVALTLTDEISGTISRVAG
jgi:hypothetical protein